MKKFALLILALFSLYHLATFAKSQPTTANWRPYFNRTYKFKLKFPANLRCKKTFTRTYFLHSAWSMNNVESKNNPSQHSILEIQLQNSRGKNKEDEVFYYQAYVRIGASSFASDLENCEKIPDSKNTTIHSKKFYAATFEDAGMSQYNSGIIYRRLENNKCYSIEYTETGTNSSSIPNYAEINERNKLLAKNIIDSFEFTNRK